MEDRIEPASTILDEATHSSPEGSQKTSVNDSSDEETRCTEIQSLCMRCHENGITKILVQTIPYFRDIVVMSFECSHCGLTNNEVQQVGELEEMGVKISLSVENERDLHRQIIKSEHASFYLPALDFEIAPETQEGICNTLEGILANSIMDLEILLQERREEEVAEKIQAITPSLQAFMEGTELPFQVVLNDPSGQSFIQNLMAPSTDPQLKIEKYLRTAEQLRSMGYHSVEAPPVDEVTKQNELPDSIECGKWDLNKSMEENFIFGDKEESISFPVSCPDCGKDGKNNMCEVEIPLFRKCILMAFSCEFCGAKENEIKPAGAIEDRGRVWNLQVKDEQDLNRDVILSDFASISFPEFDFEMAEGTHGAMISTIEGLIEKVISNLQSYQPFLIGDSAFPDQKKAHDTTISNLRKLVATPFTTPFQLILNDMVDHSFIGPRVSSQKIGTTDTNLVYEYYTRTPEQDEILGITDLKAQQCAEEDKVNEGEGKETNREVG
ncbi:ZPR1 zinc finger domain-containing protein [Cardiosporidium cionae]|uniref:ZPR1 zinc finger domain-containing protein n=1 Tax=Cardiosporidium cionae TaxID=476202 RepID=A0ABQ7JCS6_9APIC|nr:ZPR1 zinc finger domain-containing protein [Cardiosporidium cionae]|eukprot:KAF8821730.1 ZPR1 zinc finger domain-containing protein [Cardiosporidium cionae]